MKETPFHVQVDKSSSVSKNGTKDGKQRYICKDCHKNFSDNNNSIVYKSKYTNDEWISFINCELHDYILKDEASKVNIILQLLILGAINSIKL